MSSVSKNRWHTCTSHDIRRAPPSNDNVGHRFSSACRSTCNFPPLIYLLLCLPLVGTCTCVCALLYVLLVDLFSKYQNSNSLGQLNIVIPLPRIRCCNVIFRQRWLYVSTFSLSEISTGIPVWRHTLFRTELITSDKLISLVLCDIQPSAVHVYLGKIMNSKYLV